MSEFLHGVFQAPKTAKRGNFKGVLVVGGGTAQTARQSNSSLIVVLKQFKLFFNLN